MNVLLCDNRNNGFWRRYLVAGSKNVPVELFERLASDCHHAVRGRVAENASTPQFLLEQLAKDPHVNVRAALADNPAVSLDLLLELAFDPSEAVRYDLADNPLVPQEVHWVLIHDENPYVADRAEQNLKRSRHQAQQQLAAA